MSISLIANTGIQFWCEEVTFDPSTSAEVNGIPLPQLYFTEFQSLTDANRNVLHVAYKNSAGKFYTLEDLRDAGCIEQILHPDGSEDDVLDEAGFPKVCWERLNSNIVSDVDADRCYSEYNIEGAFQITNHGTFDFESPFTKVLNKWIPVPMFFAATPSESMMGSPCKWCRLRITELEKRKKGGNRYRMEWAFDTTLAPTHEVEEFGVDNLGQPFFLDGESQKEFTLPSRVGHILSFLQNNEWVSEYLATIIFGTNMLTDYRVSASFVSRCRHMAYYISLFTQLRALGAYPSVVLYDCEEKDEIPVDLVLDIGNSRTCGLMIENENFADAMLLNLRDMSNPYKLYPGSFDMHVAFRKVEFGDCNMGVESFKWNSFVRVGEEAKRLISMSAQTLGLSKARTHHSSPKRYLWDDEEYTEQWQFLQLDNADTMVQQNGIFVDGISQQLKSNGDFIVNCELDNSVATSYSRRNLMKFVFLEILQQAICQMNSFDHTSFRGNRNCRRVLNKVIVTCPTAMPELEQKVLRQCAIDAQIMLRRSANTMSIYMPYNPLDWESEVSVIPRPSHIGTPEPGKLREDWSYDEATCCQLVYLYSEIVDKYSGNAEKFISNMGHLRKELITDGYKKKSLTVGSVDIGAGTTDLMICTYKYDMLGGGSRLTPIPLFWDSFYVAGDDIMNEIIRLLVLYNPKQDVHRVNYGPIASSLYAKKLEMESGTIGENRKAILLNQSYAQVVDFFSADACNLSEEDRRMRNDFNIQISIPIAQKMLELMKNGEVQADLTYEDIFAENQPSKYLLNYVFGRFGLNMHEMKWTYSASLVTECIRTRMERVLKQLSIILHAFNCDVVLLAGRPMSLEPLTDLFLKYFPVAPNRLVRMLPKNDNAKTVQQLHNCYRVGRWFPSHDEIGYFTDLKPIVATGAYVGYLATHNKIPSMQIDMTEMRRKMGSTANYMGSYDPTLPILQQDKLALTPVNSTACLSAWYLPHYIVTKQINSEYYEARPIFALTIRRDVEIPRDYDLSEIHFTISRAYKVDKEVLILQNARDKKGNDCTDLLELKERSLMVGKNMNEYWLDNGAFRF